jgi:hypothetical protein
MKTFTKRLAAVTAAAIALAAPCAHATQGDIVVYNNSSAPIAPYFKFHCPDTDWVFFGGIAPNSQFTWNGLTPDGCVFEFTYTISGGPPPQDPVQGNHRTRLTFEADGVHVIVIGTGGILRELEGPGENGR